jgi:hypothetical protein
LQPPLRGVGQRAVRPIVGVLERGRQAPPFRLRLQVRFRSVADRAALGGVTVVGSDDGNQFQRRPLLSRNSCSQIAIVDAIRRRGQELIRPALKPVQGRERRREALGTVAFEQLDAGAE